MYVLITLLNECCCSCSSSYMFDWSICFIYEQKTQNFMIFLHSQWKSLKKIPVRYGKQKPVAKILSQKLVTINSLFGDFYHIFLVVFFDVITDIRLWSNGWDHIMTLGKKTATISKCVNWINSLVYLSQLNRCVCAHGLL